jgi:hypothetical protein
MFLGTHLLKPYNMKQSKIFLSVLFLLTLSSRCYLQNLDYGVVFETNLSNHTNTDPTKPAEGQLQWNNLTTFGAGIYASKQVFSRMNLTTALIFRQRGYTEEAQIGPIWSPIISYPSLQNRFNYISIDAKLKYLKNNSKKLKISPLVGLATNFLIKEDIESERIDEINDSYPVNQYKNNWNTLNLNYIFGFSIYQLNKYSLDFEFNRSITPLLKVETLIVKDWTWSMKLNISVQKLMSPDFK